MATPEPDPALIARLLKEYDIPVTLENIQSVKDSFEERASKIVRTETDRTIQAMKDDIVARKARLEEFLRVMCPGGSDHEYVQHRDRRPAWCPHCHRTTSGDHVTPKEKS